MSSTDEVIDMVEVTDDKGQTMWVEPGLIRCMPIRVADGAVSEDGRPVSQIPSERFSTYQNADELARMIQQIRDAEAGGPSNEIAVQPDGKIVPTAPGSHSNPTSSVPRERFASAPAADLEEIRRLDPNGVCGWRWHDSARGWSFTLRPGTFNDTDEYRFLTRREPGRHNEWFAYCLAPNLDRFIGHRHHLQQVDGNTVVCLRPGFRGHPSLRDVHGALAKWCVYIDFIQRGLSAPFSE